MKQTIIQYCIISLVLIGCSRNEKSPESIYYYQPWQSQPELYHAIQMAGIFEDSKTFADAIPKLDPEEIAKAFRINRDQSGFDLKAFVLENFDLPVTPQVEIQSGLPLETHLNGLWPMLIRSDETKLNTGTLLPLPVPYVVPGGRFREIYYWDSYFTMIGLGVSGQVDLIANMLDNFAYLIEQHGHIPNGNRSYYLSRSQPPFFALMINLYSQYAGKESALKYLPVLQKEYDFWMDGSAQLSDENPAYRRVVYYQGAILNRFWDDEPQPRPESYREDVHLAEGMSEMEKTELYRNLRAACESGWDFSTRWFADEKDFKSIRTIDLLPIDLNSLMYQMEWILSELYATAGNESMQQMFRKKAENRYDAINLLFWNETAGSYQDINWKKQNHTQKITAASFYPMFCKIATMEKAQIQSPVLLQSLLKDGGIVTTNVTSGQQWDAPNGWAPLQWIAAKGLEHYSFASEAVEIADRWIGLNRRVYDATGKMMEKYHVQDLTLLAGGGEYPTQDGFGWSNGVILGFLSTDAKY